MRGVGSRHRGWFAASFALLAAAGGTSAGCDSLNCTDATCIDVVAVAVVGLDSFVVSLEVAGQPPQTRECPLSCARFDGAWTSVFEGSPRSAALRVFGPDGQEVYQTTVRPDYHDTHPNGPTCPPTCRQANVRVEI